ncbi:histone deacetylase family protein [Cognatishimia maritima]|nr:histone deacetylase family protein [Cognatishimia maritima]
MTTALYTHPDCLDHVTPAGHPEQVARLKYIEAALRDVSGLDRRDAPDCDDDDILLCHPSDYLDMLTAAAPTSGWRSLDGDTHMSPGTLRAARRAVGANVAAVDAVMSGEVDNAFVACRPPGHHAEQSTPMGFCLFGNLAIAAKHALERHGLSRVTIVDFDVHHGNGTQALLWNERRIQFFSSHQSPLWPGSGHPNETGGHNNIWNYPLEPHSGGQEMRQVYEAEIFPAIDRYQPELILVSAGFDAHAVDPLANLNWQTDDFAWLTERICDLASVHCGGRLVSTLEGGYDLRALADSVAAHVTILMERSA